MALTKVNQVMTSGFGTAALANTGTASGNVPLFANNGRIVGYKPNIVQAVKTDTFTTASSSWTPITGISASITPQVATSKVMVEVCLTGVAGGTGSGNTYLRLKRGSTVIGVGDSAGSRLRATAGFNRANDTNDNYALETCTFKYLDSPATTGATTYSVEVISPNSLSVQVNVGYDDTDANTRARTISTITLTEIPV